jgi:nucleotide-binding universal stress UspA family protein
VSDERTLVFGDDGSPSSDTAWSWVDHQLWNSWRLQVVHAETPPWGPPLAPDEVRLHPWEPADPRRPAPSTGFATVEHLTAKADPRVALMVPADLLVVGPRGRGTVGVPRLGSVAEWLLVHPPSPLVIARTRGAVQRVLVAHDGSESADLAVASLCAMPSAATASCTVVVVADGRVDVDRAVERAVTPLRRAGVDSQLVLAHGTPTAAIAGEIDRRDPDLAVFGTRGLTGFRRFHVGSTAGALARSVRCSVLMACAARDDGEH